jgi:hypothetical protein
MSETGWVETRDAKTQDIRIVINISQYDITRLSLDDWDRKLLEDCLSSNSLADRALALEMLLRRISQQLYPIDELPDGNESK